ncbi:hypothetical protein SAMN02745220_05283 [Desulfopila aestuarii DSM 18488]|uniref:Uncharacterized protein n=1 Tax=Desulfopila aestuarii DSM 18488 TaxID=1121416 RepID=A0A1M7YM59_9BACT|nr:hypothetical protein SAMN02745220_05283 [Desulfopila aestuarii DSM 18488]
MEKNDRHSIIATVKFCNYRWHTKDIADSKVSIFNLGLRLTLLLYIRNKKPI